MRQIALMCDSSGYILTAPGKKIGMKQTKRKRAPKPAESSLTVTIPSLIRSGRDADFGEMISLMYAALGRLQTMRRTLAKSLGLSASEFAVIITLLRAQEGSGLRIRRIADELHVAAANVTVTVVKLEKMGWVAKTPDPKDSRAVAINLTPQARARLRAFANGLHQVNDIWFQGTTQQEFDAVFSFFRHLIYHYPPALNMARELARTARHKSPADRDTN
jgi:DNA-binding MarR family transcriptional regulator